MREYLIGCIETDEDLVELGYHENEEFINDVIAEYKRNLKYVEEEYSEVYAKDDAIKTVADRWAKHTMDNDIHVHTNDSGMLIQEEYDDIF